MKTLSPAGRRRVPVVQQMTMSDCGPASLASILGYHGRPTSLPECRNLVGAGRDGATARTIMTAARSFGLHSTAFLATPASLAQVALPAIAHWEAAHFVIIERVATTYIDVVDPALGRRRLTRPEFDRGFGGIVLTFTPGPDFRRQPPARRRGRLVLPAGLRRDIAALRPWLAGALVASLAVQLLGLGLPVLTAIVIERVVTPGDAALLPLLGVGVVLVTLTHLLVNHVRAMILIRLQRRVDGHVMRWLFAHLLSLPLPFFEQRARGDLMQRLGSSVVVRELVTTQTLAAILDGGFMVVYLVLLLVANPVLGGLVTALAFVHAVLLVATRTRTHQLRQRHLAAQAKAHSVLFGSLAGIATVKATGSEDELFDTWSERFSTELVADSEQNRLAALVDNAAAAVRMLAPLLLVLVGAAQVVDGTLTLGTMVALQSLAVAFLTPVGTLVTNVQRLQSARAHIERLGDVVDAAPEQAPGRQPRPIRPTGRVELRHVSFRYDTSSPLVLRDVSLSIEPGTKVALVGRSGSGKTTLAMLLLGLYPPSAGQILYDGIPLDELDRRALRTGFGVVLQEPFIFGDTIRRNIAGNEPEMPLNRVVAAARVAALDSDVNRMPMRYETRLGDGGGGLSGGQRQRLAIARAVAHHPALLVLDESTSHLDVLTEAHVDANLNDLACTRVVIAHRLSTVRNADLIVVLDNGTIVEQGNHDDLVAQGGHYAQLVDRQSEPLNGPALAVAS